MSNICIIKRFKKFDIKYAKFMITEIISFYSFRLNIFLKIYNVFYANKFKLAIINLLLS